MRLKFVSLFSGIGGFDLALEQLGHQCVFANDFDTHAADIYDQHFPLKTDRRDIRTVPATDIPDHDLLCAGFPCQSFSIAGKRRGFDDTRGTMFFEIARILREKQPRLCLLENVKGLLSHDHGRTFKTILSTLANLGYDCQWQIVNAKNFGIPQSRERLLIIGHLRTTTRPQVFPLTVDGSQTDPGHRPPIIPGTVDHGRFQPLDNLTTCLDANYYKGADNHGQRTMIATPSDVFVVDNGRREKRVFFNQSFTLRARSGTGGNNMPLVNAIRRMTPIECERLMGFPDNYTAGIADCHRYKLLGNAVVPPMVVYIIKKLTDSLEPSTSVKTSISKFKGGSMTEEQQQHIDNIIAQFTKLATDKYERGQREHGGDLWRKKHVLDFAIEEAIDQVIYLLTLKTQLAQRGIELGEVEDSAWKN